MRIGRLRAQLEVRIAQRLTDRVDADQRTGGQEVLALDVTGTGGVHLRPLGIHIGREELTRIQLLTGIAALGLGRTRHRHGAHTALVEARVVREALGGLGRNRGRRSLGNGTLHGGRRDGSRLAVLGGGLDQFALQAGILRIGEHLHTAQHGTDLGGVAIHEEDNEAQDNNAGDEVLVEHVF